MRGRLIFLLLFPLVVIGALAFRLPKLGNRPMHADEAVQAAIFRDLWQNGRYVYNPDEFHGPTLPYATLAASWFQRPKHFAETTEATFRIVPVLFGTGLVLLLWLLRDALGRPAVLAAGILTAVSPAMVFYNRYCIHETLLVFFTLGAIATGWRSLQSGKIGWSLVSGVCLGLMQATKETSVLAFAAMGGPLLAWAVWNRFQKGGPDSVRPLLPLRHLAWGLAAALVTAATFLSSFFTNPRGLLDGVLTYLPWVTRAGGESPHVQPWYHYLHILGGWRIADGPLWTEALILGLAAVGLVMAWLPKKSLLPGMNRSFVRWISAYTVLLTAAYSVIPYKTPWCLLGFLDGMILLAGVGAVGLVGVIPTRPLKAFAVLALLTATSQLAWQSHRTSHDLCTDQGNPYVYAHTLPDMERFSKDIEQLAAAAPDGRDMVLKVIWHDTYYWPMPWYLRTFPHVGYWGYLPEEPEAPIVIASPQFDTQLTEKLDATHLMTGFYGVRPNVLAQLWVRMDVWEAHLRRLGRL